jgi:protein TonB
VTEPVVISKVQPVYTKEARDNRITGTVELLCLIRTDGTVQVDSIRKSLGYGLDESAREAVEQWQFEPGKKDGVPVPTYTGILVNFTLR